MRTKAKPCHRASQFLGLGMTKVVKGGRICHLRMHLWHKDYFELKRHFKYTAGARRELLPSPLLKAGDKAQVWEMRCCTRRKATSHHWAESPGQEKPA